MLLISYGYKELNRADPDCGTTFTWATRAFSPGIGWMGGWGIVAADILVMPSLAQVAGQYVFLLFGDHRIGSQADNVWVLVVGVVWIVAMTAICYVGIEISANFQKALLGVELTMLLLLSVVALVKVANGTAPPGHLDPAVVLVQPVRRVLFRLCRRPHSDAVHLLGVGHVGVGQRGDRQQARDTRPGGGVRDRDPLGYLRGRRACRPVLRRPRYERYRSRQPQPPGRRPLGARRLDFRLVGFRQRPDSPAAADGAHLGRRLYSDHDPPDGEDDAFHGGLQGHPSQVRPHPPPASSPRPGRRWRWGAFR